MSAKCECPKSSCPVHTDGSCHCERCKRREAAEASNAATLRDLGEELAKSVEGVFPEEDREEPSLLPEWKRLETALRRWREGTGR